MICKEMDAAIESGRPRVLVAILMVAVVWVGPELALARSYFTPMNKNIGFACLAENLKASTTYYCDRDGRVRCLPGWSDPNNMCMVPVCTLNGRTCLNGNCTGPFSCDCEVGWTGQFCDNCLRLPGCVNGGCNNSFECNCNKGWEGMFCNTPSCPDCLHGECIAPGVCACIPGWSGRNCDVCIPRDDCKFGRCVNEPFQCKCLDGYKGVACDQPVCSSGCHPQHGFCRRPGQCLCKPGWAGDRCDQCVPYWSCVHGRCFNDPWECVCDPGYFGPNCNSTQNVDGNWGNWGQWSQCSVTCGAGFQTRQRRCDNPKPQGNGHYCSDNGSDSVQTSPCRQPPCHSDPVTSTPYPPYPIPTDPYPVPTPSGPYPVPTPSYPYPPPDPSDPYPVPNPSYPYPPPNPSDPYPFPDPSDPYPIPDPSYPWPLTTRGPSTVKPYTSTLGPYPGPPTTATWGEWAEWSSCSQSCGGGLRTRLRYCIAPLDGSVGSCHPLSDSVQRVPCNTYPCTTAYPPPYPTTSTPTYPYPTTTSTPTYPYPTTSSPSYPYSPNYQYTTIPTPTYTYPTTSFTWYYSTVTPRPTSTSTAPPSWGEWGQWSSCSQSCGGGSRTRVRYCINPLGGFAASCYPQSDSVQREPCNTFACSYPINGGYSEWSQYGPCSAQCQGQTNGVQTRRRFCNNPTPQNGGADCSALGPDKETIQCYGQIPWQYINPNQPCYSVPRGPSFYRGSPNLGSSDLDVSNSVVEGQSQLPVDEEQPKLEAVQAEDEPTFTAATTNENADDDDDATQGPPENAK